MGLVTSEPSSTSPSSGEDVASLLLGLPFGISGAERFVVVDIVVAVVVNVVENWTSLNSNKT